MYKEINILGKTILYMGSRLLLTMLSIWEHKEWYWVWWAERLGIVKVKFITTGIFEEIYAYLSLSLLLGFIIGLIRCTGLILQYCVTATYKSEFYRLLRLSILIIILNFWVIPIIGSGLVKLFLTNSLVPKYADISKFYWVLQGISQLIWIRFYILWQTSFSKVYIRSRGFWLLSVGIGIGFITPPDVFITFSLICLVFIICEGIVLLKQVEI